MNNKIASMSALMGVALTATALSPVAAAGGNTFAAESLQSGYTLAHNETTKSDAEHKCGEGMCAAEHKQGSDSPKADDKATDAEGKCGEGKCGEGKCGGEKSDSDKKAG
jgi:uncharacterized low-complexity protein